MTSFNGLRTAAFGRGHDALMGLNAYERHKKFVHDYLTYYGGSLPTSSAGATETDWDVLRKNHRFLRTDEDDAAETWEVKLAKRYYDKLFKEYCIADLSRYKEGKIGMRWRTQEVVVGKGQFICGNKRCDQRKGLASYEVNFGYLEAGEQKQALVKLRVCPTCADMLNYKKQRALAKAARRRGEADDEADALPKRHKASHTDSRGGSTGQDDRGRDGTGADDSRSGEVEGKKATQGSTSEVTDAPGDHGDDIWRSAQPKSGEPTAAEEMDKYFDDMFL